MSPRRDSLMKWLDTSAEVLAEIDAIAALDVEADQEMDEELAEWRAWADVAEEWP